MESEVTKSPSYRTRTNAVRGAARDHLRQLRAARMSRRAPTTSDEAVVANVAANNRPEAIAPLAVSQAAISPDAREAVVLAIDVACDEADVASQAPHGPGSTVLEVSQGASVSAVTVASADPDPDPEGYVGLDSEAVVEPGQVEGAISNDFSVLERGGAQPPMADAGEPVDAELAQPREAVAGEEASAALSSDVGAEAELVTIQAHEEEPAFELSPSDEATPEMEAVAETEPNERSTTADNLFVLQPTDTHGQPSTKEEVNLVTHASTGEHPDGAATGKTSDLYLLPGIGPGLVWMLEQCEVKSLAQFAATDPEILSRRMGLVGEILNLEDWVKFARKIDAQRPQTTLGHAVDS